MTNGTIDLIQTILVAVSGVTAAAALCGLALAIIRHFLQIGKSSQDYSRLADKTTRSIGTLFAISILCGIGSKVPAPGLSNILSSFTNNDSANAIKNNASSNFVPDGINLGEGTTWETPSSSLTHESTPEEMAQHQATIENAQSEVANEESELAQKSHEANAAAGSAAAALEIARENWANSPENKNTLNNQGALYERNDPAIQQALKDAAEKKKQQELAQTYYDYEGVVD